MRRILIAASTILLILISLLLIACSKDKVTVKNVDLEQITQDISAKMDIAMPTQLDEQNLTELFNLKSDQIEKFSGVFSMTMTDADTIIAIMAKNGNASVIKNAYNKRIEDIKNSLVKNFDTEYEKVEKANIYTKGDYVFLIISENNKEVQNIINKYF